MSTAHPQEHSSLLEDGCCSDEALLENGVAPACPQKQSWNWRPSVCHDGAGVAMPALRQRLGLPLLLLLAVSIACVALFLLGGIADHSSNRKPKHGSTETLELTAADFQLGQENASVSNAVGTLPPSSLESSSAIVASSAPLFDDDFLQSVLASDAANTDAAIVNDENPESAQTTIEATVPASVPESPQTIFEASATDTATSSMATSTTSTVTSTGVETISPALLLPMSGLPAITAAPLPGFYQMPVLQPDVTEAPPPGFSPHVTLAPLPVLQPDVIETPPPGVSPDVTLAPLPVLQPDVTEAPPPGFSPDVTQAPLPGLQPDVTEAPPPGFTPTTTAESLPGSSETPSAPHSYSQSGMGARANDDGSLLNHRFAKRKEFDLDSPANEFLIEKFSDWNLTHSCADYVDDGTTVFSRDGKLVLKVSSEGDEGRSLKSGRVRSKDDFSYGLFVFTAKVPKCNHVWPAIWLLPSDVSGEGPYGPWPCSGEIDVLESINSVPTGAFDIVAGYGTDEMGCGNDTTKMVCNQCMPKYCTSTTLGKPTWGANNYFVEDVLCEANTTNSWDYHVFVFSWQPGEMVTWADPLLGYNEAGDLTSIVPKPPTRNIPSWKAYRRETTPSWQAVRESMDVCNDGGLSSDAPFDIPMKIVMNIAIGGYAGAPCVWNSMQCSNPNTCGSAVGSELVLADLQYWQAVSPDIAN